jgi:hypothetical protein
MRRILGSILFVSLLIAEPYHFHSQLSKSELYLGEALVLDCYFDREVALSELSAKIEIAKSEVYEVKEISLDEKHTQERTILHQRFLITPKSSGAHKIQVINHLLKTNKDAQKESTVGLMSVRVLQLDDEIKKSVATHNIRVNPLPKPTPYIGLYRMHLAYDSKPIVAGEPLDVTLTIEADGIIDETLKSINFEIDEVKSYTHINSDEVEYDEQGVHTKLIKRFALVGLKSFQLPSLQLSYWDLAQEKLVTLSTPSAQIEVKPNESYVKQISQGEDEPFDFAMLLSIMGYVVALLIGIMIGRWVKLPTQEERELTLQDEIRHAKRSKEVIKMLLPFSHDPSIRGVLHELETKSLTSAHKDQIIRRLDELLNEVSNPR